MSLLLLNNLSCPYNLPSSSALDHLLLQIVMQTLMKCGLAEIGG